MGVGIISNVVPEELSLYIALAFQNRRLILKTLRIGFQQFGFRAGGLWGSWGCGVKVFGFKAVF